MIYLNCNNFLLLVHFLSLKLSFLCTIPSWACKNAKLNEMCGMWWWLLACNCSINFKKVFKQCKTLWSPRYIIITIWSCSFYVFKIQLRPSSRAHYYWAHHQSTRLNKAPFPRLSLSLSCSSHHHRNHHLKQLLNVVAHLMTKYISLNACVQQLLTLTAVNTRYDPVVINKNSSYSRFSSHKFHNHRILIT